MHADHSIEAPTKAAWDAAAVDAAHAASVRRREEAIAHLAIMLNDSRAEARREAHLCPACFYLGGHHHEVGRKTHPCKNCGTPIKSGILQRQALCTDCATSNDLCERCGAPMDSGLPTEKGAAANG